MPEGVGPGSDPVSQPILPSYLPSRSNFHDVQWPYADHRCQYACENMAAKVRRMEEAELKTCSPCLILPMFVAARFYIGMYLPPVLCVYYELIVSSAYKMFTG